MATTRKLVHLVAYLRVSSAGQVDGYGLAVQEADIRSWAKRNGARIVRVCRDEAVKGSVEAVDREGLSCAIDAVREGVADGIVVANLSRLARTLTVQEAAMALIWRAGGRVFTTDAGEVMADDPDDPMRTAIRKIVGVIHELDRSTIALRLRKGREAKAAAGGYAGGAPSYGVRAQDGALVPDDREAATVAQIVAWRSEGASLRTITARLNEAGIPSKRGGAWHPTAVARLL